MIVTRQLQETPVMDNAHKVDARNLYDTPDAMITIITLQPGQALKRHVTPVDVAFYVLEGSGDVEIGEERKQVSKDTLVESPRDILHCWYNTSAQPLRFMVIKAPRPGRKTVFVGDK
jgi:mannose-6-phosphate isomerase-like protein (cupin superfamily)